MGLLEEARLARMRGTRWLAKNGSMKNRFWPGQGLVRGELLMAMHWPDQPRARRAHRLLAGEAAVRRWHAQATPEAPNNCNNAHSQGNCIFKEKNMSHRND
jgi:hypothetical protein